MKGGVLVALDFPEMVVGLPIQITETLITQMEQFHINTLFILDVIGEEHWLDLIDQHA